MIPFDQRTFLGRQRISLIPEITFAILRTIEAGWRIARRRRELSTDADEVTVTECLRDGMRVALNDLPWKRAMIVSPGTESRSREGMTRPDGRTDIPLYLLQVYAQTSEHDPHAIVECKRLSAGSTRLAREYVLQGIDRFRARKYSQNHDHGFMAGYVQSGEAAEVVALINAYLIRRKRHSELLTPQATEMWVSKHSRVQQAFITLYHMMLCFAE